MSVVKLTRADLGHVMQLVSWAQWVLYEYPELFTKDEEEELMIVEQLTKEKLHENTDD